MNQIFSQQLCLDQPLATRIFSQSIKQNKLAKSYLLAGEASVDKWRLTYELSAYFNCDKVRTQAHTSCFNQPNSLLFEQWCTNCRWLEADKHPQALIKLSGANNKSGKIAVEEARHFVEEVAKTSPYFRIMVIEESGQEVLHRAAANTLLKTVEEPRSQLLMFFFTPVANDVLPTIASRCQTIIMSSSFSTDYFSLAAPNKTKGIANNSEQEIYPRANQDLIGENSSLTDTFPIVENIHNLIKDGLQLETVLDFYIAQELLAMPNLYSAKTISYVKDLFLIGQIAKEQNKHFVSQKAVVESFVYAWHRLKTTGVSPLKLQR